MIPKRFVLTLSCPNSPEVIYRISKYLMEHDGAVTESQQFTSPTSGMFFLRVAFTAAGAIASLDDDFRPVARDLAMSYRLTDASIRQRVLIMVSKYGHCLNDLLYRSHNGDLNVEVAAVTSNHPDLAILADNYRVPFFHVPVTAETKKDSEARILELVEAFHADLVVLARYMQILSDDMCKELDGRAINIHHSILPSFKGARPYYQAYDRGVKLVGATAHYVTSELDEGPIIEQEVARVDHSMSAEEVTALGRDNESRALSRAVRWHCDNRILLDGHHTVVFR